MLNEVVLLPLEALPKDFVGTKKLTAKCDLLL